MGNTVLLLFKDTFSCPIRSKEKFKEIHVCLHMIFYDNARSILGKKYLNLEWLVRCGRKSVNLTKN